VNRRRLEVLQALGRVTGSSPSVRAYANVMIEALQTGLADKFYRFKR
jgi:hypothetical protein